MAFCPRSMDSAAVDGIGSGLVLLAQCSSRLGLPSSLSCFFLGAVAFHVTTLTRNKDLQDDKEGYAIGVA